LITVLDRAQVDTVVPSEWLDKPTLAKTMLQPWKPWEFSFGFGFFAFLQRDTSQA
jgi:hypothetical protein